MFCYPRQIQFYETDLMGIVHHGNYLRIYEEARVSWAHHHGILDYQKPETASHLAVLETAVRHIKPSRFGDKIEVQVQAKIEGIKIIFEYKMLKPVLNKQSSELISEARTTHVALNLDLKPIKPPQPLKSILENEKWTETWLLNL